MIDGDAMDEHDCQQEPWDDFDISQRLQKNSEEDISLYFQAE